MSRASEHLNQIRQIHLWFLLIASLLSYIAISSYNNAPEVLRELARLQGFLKLLEEPRTNLQALAPIWATQTQRTLSRDLFQDKLTNDGVFLSSLKIEDVSPVPKLEQPLETAIEEMQQFRFKLLTITTASLDQKEQIAKFITDGFPGRSLRSCEISSLLPTWGERSADGLVPVKVTYRCYDSGSPDATDLVVEKTEDFYLSSREMELKAEFGWPSAFPYLASAFTSVGHGTLDQARKKTVSALRAEGLKTPLPFLSMTLPTKDLSIVLPIVQAILLTYMLAHLHELKRFLKSTSNRTACSIIWVGVMPSRLAKMVALFTIVFLPGIPIAVVLYRNVWPTLLWTPVVFGYFGIAYLVFREAKAISVLLLESR